MKRLIIIGAGGFGREVAWLVERINHIALEWELIGFIDDNPDKWGKCVYDRPVIGGIEVATDYPFAYYVCAVGNAAARRLIIRKLQALLTAPLYATLIAPSVIMSSSVKIGEGSIICAGSILTVDISIGCHSIINLSCTIGHDSVLSDFVTLYPSVNISGNSHIAEGAELGTGSATIQGIRIGKDTIVGAKAVVVRDLPSSCTAVGVPARVIKGGL